MAERETRLMRRVRNDYGGQPLKDILAAEYKALGLPGMSEKMHISRGTLWYWMIKEGFKIERRLVSR